MQINETTKRFPRSLEEAFPQDYPDQYVAIHLYARKVRSDWMVFSCAMFGFGFLLGLLLGEIR